MSILTHLWAVGCDHVTLRERLLALTCCVGVALLSEVLPDLGGVLQLRQPPVPRLPRLPRLLQPPC